MPISDRKKGVFYLLLALFFYIFVEILAYGAFWITSGGFSFAGLQGKRNAIVADADRRLQAAGEIDRSVYRLRGGNRLWRKALHPYLGYVDEAIDLNKPCPDPADCNRRIKTVEDRPFAEKSPDKLIVGVLGGSFAHGTCRGSTPGLLAAELRKIPAYHDKKEIVVYDMAPGGYKQPQQVMKLNYFLSLGAQFDVVINIDGFNEIVLPTENISKGVHPAYPRSWYYQVQGGMTPGLLALHGRREYLQNRQSHWAAWFSGTPARYLVSANFIWYRLDKHLNGQIRQTDVRMVEYEQRRKVGKTYAVTGPDYRFTTWDAYFRQMSAIWRRCSLQLFHLCRGQQIAYYHFLQPNQYVPGSKPMSDAEKAATVSETSGYGQRARNGYPYLIDQGHRLRDQEVPFFDLTGIFKTNTDWLYVDTCCHLNQAGYDLVVKAMVAHIIADGAG